MNTYAAPSSDVHDRRAICRSHCDTGPRLRWHIHRCGTCHLRGHCGLRCRGVSVLAQGNEAFSIGLGVYGSAFVLQTVLLTSYVGSRTIDIAWGSLIVAIGAFLFRSESLEHHYFESEQGLGVKNMGANSNSSDA